MYELHYETGEGTKVVPNEGAERSRPSLSVDNGGQAGQSDNKGVPQDDAAMSEAIEDTDV